jgi:hypothetical protein
MTRSYSPKATWSPPPRSPSLAILVAVSIGLTSCRDTAGPGADAATPGLRVISGAGVSDTIDARLGNPLIVELRDSTGRAMPGAVLQVGVAVTAPAYLPNGVVAKSPAGPSLASYVDTTDAKGRASISVGLGRQAGTTGIIVRTADARWQTEASFTVLPGAPASLTVAPGDTAVYVARTFQLAAVVRDRGGNLRTETPTYSTLTSRVLGVTTSGAASTVAVGRGAIRAALGAIADTVNVSSVPPGTIVASAMYGSSGLSSIRTRVFTVNLDGTARTEVIASPYWAEPAPAFSPDGTSLVFPLGYHDTKLYVATGSVPPRPFGGAPVTSEGYPRFSRDGQWIYFNGRPGSQNCAIWRVRRDGGGAEQLSPPINDYEIDANPDPSPDGTRLAYNTNRLSFAMPVIRLLDVATRKVTALDVPGVTPRWSPDGSRIAYIPTEPYWGYIDDNRVMLNPGPLTLMRPDGTDRQAIPTGTVGFNPGFAWSPDGTYIVARSSTGSLAVVVVATGEVLPLPFSGDLYLPDWKP